MTGRTVFLDVGAHWGETAEEVLSPFWRFDRIYAFEPDPQCVARLNQTFAADVRGGRLEIVAAALSNHDGDAQLFGSNEGGGASLLAEKKNVDAARHIQVPLRSTAAFFAEHIRPDDTVIMKLNCEGGEIDIIKDLVASGAILRIANLVVDFDIRKVRGREREARVAIRSMRAAGFNDFMLAERVMIGPDARARVRNWLSQVEAARAVCTDPAALQPPRRAKLSRRLKAAFRYL